MSIVRSQNITARRYQAASESGKKAKRHSERLFFLPGQVDGLSALKITHLPHPLHVYPKKIIINAPKPQIQHHQTASNISFHPKPRSINSPSLPSHSHLPSSTTYLISHPPTSQPTHLYPYPYTLSSSSLSLNYPNTFSLLVVVVLRFLSSLHACLPVHRTD